MNRFLAVAVVSRCGELVECKGWETERLSSRNPLMAHLPSGRAERARDVIRFWGTVHNRQTPLEPVQFQLEP